MRPHGMLYSCMVFLDMDCGSWSNEEPSDVSSISSVSQGMLIQ